MSEFAPGNAPTPAVEGAIPTPILAHTNGGDAMPVSAPDTAQTVDSDIALRRPSAVIDDAEHVDDMGWARMVVVCARVVDRHVQDAWLVRSTSGPWSHSLPTTLLRSEPVAGWSSPLRAFSTRHGRSPTKP